MHFSVVKFKIREAKTLHYKEKRSQNVTLQKQSLPTVCDIGTVFSQFHAI